MSVPACHIPGGALEERLEKLLDAASDRDRRAFDEAAEGCEGRIVIYGAGELGRRTLDGLRANGVEPLAFADRNRELWNQSIGGVAIMPPDEAARRFGADSVFVIAAWHPSSGRGMRDIAAALTAHGGRRWAPFAWLFWKYPPAFLPYYFWDLPSRLQRSGAAIRQAFALFEGRSQAEFVRQLELRLTGDANCLTPPDRTTQYFPERLFRPVEDEYFLDCGSFDGDSLRGLDEWTGGSFRGAVAFEADPASFAALRSSIATRPEWAGKVRAIHVAVGSRRGRVRFNPSGRVGAAISAAGSIEVDLLPLDEISLPEKPTYLKMDIEGSEMEALRGAENLLRRYQPLAAVCAYHRPEDLWQIPLQLHEYLPSSRLLLRSYNVDGWELVCYAVPPDRPADFAEEAAAS